MSLDKNNKTLLSSALIALIGILLAGSGVVTGQEFTPRAPLPSPGGGEEEHSGGAGSYVIGIGGNANPVARDDIYITDAGAQLIVEASTGLLANDDDPEGNILTVSTLPVIEPSHGGLVLYADGGVDYLPDPGFVGSDTFSYAVNDGNGGTGYARVTIRVGTTAVPFEFGVIDGVSNTGWTPVTLSAEYLSMIVIATPAYDETAPPQITRIRNAAGNGFELRVERFDGSNAPLAGTDVHYFVIEKGIYTAAEHGIAIEAQHQLSTLTDHRDSWKGSPVAYINAYNSPVVLGQVMTYADARPSVFWARGSHAAEPPTNTVFFGGKHVGEDLDIKRANELLGYVVVEAGQHIIGDRSIIADVVTESVTGMGQAPPYRYDIGGLLAVSGGILSSAGMNETDGGWPVLYGATPVTTSYLDLAIDEDQIGDAEREHTAEQAAFLIAGYVNDIEAPVITLLGDNPQIVEAGSAYTELGATATDTVDGDISANIMIDATAVDTATPGSYEVTYNVADLAGNAADTVIRTVNVVDTTIPVITLLGNNPQTIEAGSAYTELNATAEDNLGGDISANIIIDATAVDTATPGSYSVTYNVSDAAGNPAETATRTVNVVDTLIPVITLLGPNPQTIEVGNAYVELDATAEDNFDGNISANIVIDANTVDTSTPGGYAVTYNVSDAAGNAADTVTRTVNVVDTTIPVITLLGANPQMIEAGDPYVELDATAADNLDGDISANIAIDATNVDTATPGSYSVTYNVSDAAGNPAETETRTVNVVDTTIPVITLLGPNPQTIEAGDTYVELDATATDNLDGNISANIVIDATNVDTATPGTYSVTYNVSDAAGNPAETVIRTVNVVDTTIPVITLLGPNPQTIEAGSAYTELGATALDNLDGDISINIVIDAAAVDASTPGEYSVTYNVSDAAGNPAETATRTVNVVDTTIPVITLLGNNPQTIEAGSAYTELNATALDNLDGDISANIVIDATNVDTATPGSYSVTYNVSDAAGNPAETATRTVNVVDTTIPVITLLGPNPQTIEAGSAYTELGATALDNLDGDISANIVIDATAVDTATPGEYSVTYNVSDAAGNPAETATRTVNVVDTTIPVITLLGNNPQTIEAGSAYTELGATALDNLDGDISVNILIDAAAVDASTPGEYSVTYNVSDAAGNAADTVTRTVNVVDTTIPVITLLGNNPQTIEAGSAYTELNATALDNLDGDISANIVIDATNVDTATPGSYSVTYNVSDAAGNAADTVTRTVNVVDTTIPVITLLGNNPQTIEAGSAYTELNATALDNLDGDISANIVIDATNVDTATPGSYSVTYNVSDAAGNAADTVTRTVNVVDTTIPVITLLGNNPQTIEAGSAYTELNATALDNLDGDISINIVIDAAAVDASTPGEYSVTYNVSDAAGNPAETATRTVNVVDTTIPVITLLGNNPQTIEAGSAYTELDATAEDNLDGNISENIVIDATNVDTATPGSYSVTYNVSDAAGNPAETATRTVNVVDTTIPVITLLGNNPQTIEAGSAYTELNATALDNLDGDISINILIDAAAVDASTPGEYSVTYNVSDAAGNPAETATRTVNVVDTTIPVITLLGPNPQTIEAGSAYTELGATALDNLDGDISVNILIDAAAVDASTPGEYSVTYNVSDAAGNPAETATRTVNVVDTTIPVITLLGNNPQTIEAGSAYTELGATALDNLDGDISINIVIDAAAVDASTPGEYSVTYNVSDAAGNPAETATRTVNVVDTTIPVITLLGNNPQTIEAGSAYTELGATALDNLDGDISVNILIDAAAVDASTPGEYSVTYNVSDAAGNAADTVTRTVNVVDTTIPVITLLGNNPQTIEAGSAYTELNATALDNLDGDISANIVIDATDVDTATPGSYSVTYNVSDAAGNPAETATRTVNVVDTTIPVITLLGANPQTIEAGDPYVELDATAQDNLDGDISANIAIDATNVDTATPGTYSVIYDVSDAAGNPAETATRTVNVVDTTIPVITLLGANPQTIEAGDLYVELGATAQDNLDGDISANIAIDATNVDTATPGTYSVTYDVSDAAGNAAETVTRTVNVVDTTIPVITLLGANPQVIEVGSVYTELGATAVDNLDGDISTNIVIDATAVDTSTPGVYPATYNVSDAAGNAADTVIRTVNVVDPGALIKVMPIGDSITEGNPNYHTYRFYLSQMYPDLDMVGSKTGVVGGQVPLDPNFDQDHQSYWGQRADQVATEVDWAADVYVPDVALVHLGTNDLLHSESIESTVDDLELLVQHLRDANSNVKVFVAQIIHCNWAGCAQQDDLNAAIAAMVPTIDTPQSPVYLVPMDDLGVSDLRDGVHPNNTGSQKMMWNWEAAMQSAGVL